MNTLAGFTQGDGRILSEHVLPTVLQVFEKLRIRFSELFIAYCDDEVNSAYKQYRGNAAKRCCYKNNRCLRLGEKEDKHAFC